MTQTLFCGMCSGKHPTDLTCDEADVAAAILAALQDKTTIDLVTQQFSKESKLPATILRPYVEKALVFVAGTLGNQTPELVKQLRAGRIVGPRQ